MAKIVINTELETKSFDKQIQTLENKLASEKKRLERLMELQAKGVFTTDYGVKNIESLNVSIEKTRNQLISLREQQIKTGEDGEQAGERSGRGFEKGIRSLKRFGMALLGVRGMFTLIRRATSSYLSEHQETANKINAIWVALGNALAPIIETIANAVLYLIGYLNVFLQALGFDVDLTKNMGKSKKAIKETSGAMKELNRQVASFDEMNVVQKDTSTGGAGGGTDDTGAFKMPKLDEGIVKILKDVAGWLKENWTWLSAIAGLLIGKKLLDKLFGLGTALGTLGKIGLVVAGVNILYNAVTGRDLIEDLGDIIDYLKTMPQFMKDNTQFKDNNNKAWTNWLKSSKENRKELKAGTKEQKIYYSQLKTTIEGNATDNKLLREKAGLNKNNRLALDSWMKVNEEYEKRIGSNNQSMQETIEVMAEMYEAGQLDAKQTANFEAILRATGGTIENGKVKLGNLNTLYQKGGDYVKNYADVLDAVKVGYEHGGKAGEQFGSDIKIATGKVEDGILKATNLKESLNKLTGVVVNPKVKVTDNIDEVKNKLKNLAASLTVGTSLNLNKVKSFFGLSKGGIVNNPGRGVPITNVITGEATNGAEGVVPMNNDEAMDVLGRAIARHVQINLTNNTMLDSKVIARSVSQIQDSTNFITNGRGA